MESLNMKDILKQASQNHKKVALVVDGPIYYVVLNKPPHNSIDADFITDYNLVLDTIEAKIKENVGKQQIMVTIGNGSKCFSSGFDLKFWGATPANFFQTVLPAQNLFARILTFPIPNMCAINGHCIAAGVFLALAHEYRTMVDDTKFKIQLNELQNGIPLPWGCG
mmetsp:Transcript_11840/g.20019  ORF Transcript_11840/g.20019 Transcript_11840/m.20019 type:complete len:166 (+) Transcript_11840:31-528(+)